MRFVHEVYGSKYAEEVTQDFYEALQSAAAASDEKALVENLAHTQEDLSPLVVRELFKKITDDDAELLWLSPRFGRPENLILDNLLVPPVTIRPSVAMDIGGGSNEDDLTMKLQEIVDVNTALGLAMHKGAQASTIMDHWNVLQLQVAHYLNGEVPHRDFKSIRGLVQRIKGKQGRFRGNLSGKRVDFSARTVISPDPNLRITQVGVPLQVAKTMTYPERVNEHNLERLKRSVENGPAVWPGANLVRSMNNTVKHLGYGDRTRIADAMRIGDTVERHMNDNDVVLFNRQPSLHKLSIMAHRVKVMPWRTFRFNECVCAPYNADFDGDEMNMHLPQTEEARAEASLLMGVQENLVTPRNGEPLVAATQDFLTASYLVTQRSQFFTHHRFMMLCAWLGDATERIDVPPPAILKPVPLWTGKQLFSILVRPRRDSPILVNFENKEKCYTGGKSGAPANVKHWCRDDGYVVMRNSKLLAGVAAKKTLGDGGKSGLFYVLLRDHGAAEAALAMNRVAKFSARYLGEVHGFSIGIADVTPSADLRQMKTALLGEGYTNAESAIEEYNRGSIQLKPGCDALQSLEAELNGLLGRLRESAGKAAMGELPFSNAPRTMADCGSKGSPLNISQMMACVGQQSVGGKRIQEGFVNRTLPHFEKNALEPAARGFVANSFYSGLTATEFFFHTMGGREGLVDTAVKTAETGYMARRLMKALEDLSMHYDNTVRNSEKSVVQFVYGDDGLNPQVMEGDSRPVNLLRLQQHLAASLSATGGLGADDLLSPGQLRALVEERLDNHNFRVFKNQNGGLFIDEVRGHFEAMASRMEALAGKLGIDPARPDAGFWNGLNGPDGSEGKVALQILGKCAGMPRALATRVLDVAEERYARSMVEPGEAVGAIGAQSISEPGTQMTLKTFHFAGVASMNVTLGVPRLKEIINASSKISTPIITARLLQDDNEISARVVKARLEKTTLGEVALKMQEVLTPADVYISVHLDMNAIAALHLNIDCETVKECILSDPFGTRSKRPQILRALQSSHVLVHMGRRDRLRVRPPDGWPGKTTGKNAATLGIPPSRAMYFVLQDLKAALTSVIVQGIPSIGRAVINQEDGEGGRKKYTLLVEGKGLGTVMGTPGVEGRLTESNNICEVLETLGIEAARLVIIKEIDYIMASYGISIDKRHLMLLSDVMTFKGEVLGITRFGVAKMRESVLMLASFEKTADHLFDAAAHGRSDAITGVSECIIMGIPIPLGTGLFKLLRRAEMAPHTRTRRPTLL
uniref:DNA-directed RNA polymerase subunit n=1 Tax=Phaeomonas parva TaxID=124430 RepID=A0A7S1XTP6_9STRA